MLVSFRGFPVRGGRLLAAASTTFEAAVSWWGLLLAARREAGAAPSVSGAVRGRAWAQAARTGVGTRLRTSAEKPRRRSGPGCARRPTRPARRPAAAGRRLGAAPTSSFRWSLTFWRGSPGRVAGMAAEPGSARAPRIRARLGSRNRPRRVLDHSVVQHRSRISPTKKIVKAGNIVGGDRLRTGRAWEPSDPGKRPGIQEARDTNASARKSHEADLMSACDPRLVRSSARAARAVGAPLRAV